MSLFVGSTLEALQFVQLIVAYRLAGKIGQTQPGLTEKVLLNILITIVPIDGHIGIVGDLMGKAADKLLLMEPFPAIR